MATNIGNSSMNISRNLERCLEDCVKSGELRLPNRKLKDFPKIFGKYNLQDTLIADLSRNRFLDVPEDIFNMIFLEELHLYHNTLKIIPPSIRNLTSLTFLDLRSNQLTSLPRQICFLPIQILLVSNNKLIQLPDDFGKMTELTEFDASSNQLSHLPTRLCELTKLRSLGLRSNQINFLPKELASLNLVSLDLSCNRISSLPLEIRFMTDLIDLNLTDNPLTSPPAQLCSRGTVFIFKYLDAIARDGCTKVDGANSLRRSVSKKSSHYIYESMKSKTNSPESADYNFEPFTKLDIIPNSFHMRSELSKSDTSTPTGIFPSALNETLLDNELLKRKLENREVIKSDPTSMHNISVLNEVIPAKLLENQKTPEKLKSIETIQTYREYKEALKQQRSNDIYSVYKSKEAISMVKSESENSNLTENQKVDSPRKNSSVNNVHQNEEKSTLIRNNEKNGNCQNGNGNHKDSYTKPNSPMKLSKFAMQNRIGATGNSNKIHSNVANARNKSTNINRTWDCEGNEKSSFTMRREFDRHKEEAELMKQLKTIIETKLKMVMPEDIASALNDGVVLCHLANHVRQQSVGSIHVPSATVPKLTMARCRRNVDNFLEACRKIGVDEDVDVSSLSPETLKSKEQAISKSLKFLSDQPQSKHEDYSSKADCCDSIEIININNHNNPAINTNDKMLSNILLAIFILSYCIIYILSKQ